MKEIALQLLLDYPLSVYMTVGVIVTIFTFALLERDTETSKDYTGNQHMHNMKQTLQQQPSSFIPFLVIFAVIFPFLLLYLVVRYTVNPIRDAYYEWDYRRSKRIRRKQAPYREDTKK